MKHPVLYGIMFLVVISVAVGLNKANANVEKTYTYAEVEEALEAVYIMGYHNGLRLKIEACGMKEI